MKVLVLSNCSLQSYVAYLRAAHPAWDVRGVLIPQAKKFVEDKHQGFMEFLGQVDLFLGLTDLDFMDSYFPASTQRLYVPRFSYFGLQPDAFFVAQLPSVLGRGVAHSRLAMQSYLKGLNLSEAEALFNADTFDRMGYFERRDVDREQMTKRFAKFRIDVSELIDYWIKQSLFLYYPSHPKIQFFFDLIDLIMRGSGIPPDISAVRLQEC